ncbi:hypothetical protein PMIT1320_00041 [Prochlorococcus marinus str. MIT 1320]|nr:hypothetical protein PMIT1320_00041 [Prochlorococcus marinus str. MIT 1320]
MPLPFFFDIPVSYLYYLLAGTLLGFVLLIAFIFFKVKQARS